MSQMSPNVPIYRTHFARMCPGAPRRTIHRAHGKTNPPTLASLASWRSAFPSHDQKLQNKAKCHPVTPAQTRHNLPKPATAHARGKTNPLFLHVSFHPAASAGMFQALPDWSHARQTTQSDRTNPLAILAVPSAYCLPPAAYPLLFLPFPFSHRYGDPMTLVQLISAERREARNL